VLERRRNRASWRLGHKQKEKEKEGGSRDRMIEKPAHAYIHRWKETRPRTLISDKDGRDLRADWPVYIVSLLNVLHSLPFLRHSSPSHFFWAVYVTTTTTTTTVQKKKNQHEQTVFICIGHLPKKTLCLCSKPFQYTSHCPRSCAVWWTPNHHAEERAIELKRATQYYVVWVAGDWLQSPYG
jgi:hypothetical protein